MVINMSTSEQHEQVLKETIEKLKSEGYHVIDLERKSPDAIAVKDGKIIAIEVLGITHIPSKGWKHKWTHKAKQQVYHMFDELKIITFKRNKAIYPHMVKKL